MMQLQDFTLHALIGQKFAGLPYRTSAPEVEGDEVETRISYRTEGVDVLVDASWITVGILLYGHGDDYHTKYVGPMPSDISFSMSRSELRQKLGVPKRGMEKATIDKLVGRVEPFDEFEWQGMHLGVRYSPRCDAISYLWIDPALLAEKAA